MKTGRPSTDTFYTIEEKENREFSIRLQGRIDSRNATGILKALCDAMTRTPPALLTVDLDRVTYLDDFGVLVLFELKHLTEDARGTFRLANIRENAQGILEKVNFESRPKCQRTPPQRSFNLFLHLGESAIHLGVNIRFFISFLGSLLLSVVHVILHPRSLRLSDTITHMEKTGVGALPIVALISFLLGLIMAFMSALQLKQFGANIYVASLVAIAMVSELGPIMTAIIVAGRSGSAYAAEIGTMKINEEIDALFTMGFDPTVFLAVPRIFASVIVLPILTLFSNLFAIAGGLAVGVLLLNLTLTSYIVQTLESLSVVEVIWGLGKSVIFALLIAWIGCLRGFQAKGGATAVGNAATSAVVSSVFLIILFDSIFAVIRSYYGFFSIV
ncbi:MAG: MlaE family lipid ABC transporter permease subunit [Desulfobacterales bacterium]|nr:MlaE family lipid ABC transporter permease subunit [Desulfobacterales bacterium]